MLEELAILPIDLLLEAVFPTIQRKNTWVVGLSSAPLEEDSPMNMMINARYLDTNELIFNTRVFARICPSCRARGRTDCKHKVEVSWSNQRQARKVAGLMAHHQNVFRVEILNEGSEPNIARAFPDAIATPFIESEYTIHNTSQIRQLFIGIDPSAGGNQSKFAIVTLAFVEREGAQKRPRLHGGRMLAPSDDVKNLGLERRYDTVVHFFFIFFTIHCYRHYVRPRKTVSVPWERQGSRIPVVYLGCIRPTARVL